MVCRCLWQILLQGGLFESSLINDYTILLSFISQERTLKIWVWLLCEIRCVLCSFIVQLCIPDLFRHRLFIFLYFCWRCSVPGLWKLFLLLWTLWILILPPHAQPPDFCKINHWKQWEKEPTWYHKLKLPPVRFTSAYLFLEHNRFSKELWNKAPKNAYIFMVVKALISVDSFIPVPLTLSLEMPGTPFKQYYLNCFRGLK